jgi:hypothetical protein
MLACINGKYGVYFMCRYLSVLNIWVHCCIICESFHGYYIWKDLYVCLYTLLFT